MSAPRRKPKKRPPRSDSGNAGILVGLRARTAAEKATWEGYARADGRSFADWARRALAQVGAEQEIRRSLERGRAER